MVAADPILQRRRPARALLEGGQPADRHSIRSAALIPFIRWADQTLGVGSSTGPVAVRIGTKDEEN
jgi:hypothetical protein